MAMDDQDDGDTGAMDDQADRDASPICFAPQLIKFFSVIVAGGLESRTP
jgi:hypothetical protein